MADDARRSPGIVLKLFVLLAVFSVMPVGALAWWQLSAIAESQRSQRLAALDGLASAKASAIDQSMTNRRRDVERIATLMAPRLSRVLEAEQELAEASEAPAEPAEPLPELQDAGQLDEPDEIEAAEEAEQEALEAPPEPPEAEAPSASPTIVRHTEALEQARAELRRSLGLILWDQADFEELLVIDGEGRVRSSTYSDHEGRTAESIEYFRQGRRATYVQPVFMSPITERWTMVIATPIRDENAVEIGVLAARLNLAQLFGLINDVSGLGETGETVVGRIIGDELVLMAPTRSQPDAILRRYPIGEVEQMPVTLAARGQQGRGEKLDYRQDLTLSAWRPIPSLEWGLVVKMDADEAMRDAEEAKWRTLQVALVILLLAVVAALLVARQVVRPLRQLREATDRLSRGDFDVRLDIRSRDEIGELADSFERMVAAIKFFREHARPESEMDDDSLEAEEGADDGSATQE
ncbi:MAG: HAMP domain-containing protein [Myxococcota bacterium]|nr:HAMP domain-containing protein [Myxococcota bacterium]